MTSPSWLKYTDQLTEEERRRFEASLAAYKQCVAEWEWWSRWCEGSPPEWRRATMPV